MSRAALRCSLGERIWCRRAFEITGIHDSNAPCISLEIDLELFVYIAVHFPQKKKNRTQWMTLKRKSQGHVIFSDSVINEYTTKLCSYVYISFLLVAFCCFYFDDWHPSKSHWTLVSWDVKILSCFLFSFAKVPLLIISLYFYICFHVWFFIFRIILFKIRLMKKCT